MSKPTLEDWLSWKSLCSVERCEPQSRNAIRSFLNLIHHDLLQNKKYSLKPGLMRSTGPWDAEGLGPDPFASTLFDTGFYLSQNGFKHEKDALLMRIYEGMDAYGKSFDASCRTNVRIAYRAALKTHLRELGLFNQKAEQKTDSLQEQTGENQTKEETLASLWLQPADEMAEKELDKLINQDFPELFAPVSRTDRLCLLALCQWGLLSDPMLADELGLKKSQISTRAKEARTRWIAGLRKKRPEFTDTEGFLYQRAMTEKRLYPALHQWAKGDPIARKWLDHGKRVDQS